MWLSTTSQPETVGRVRNVDTQEVNNSNEDSQNLGPLYLWPEVMMIKMIERRGLQRINATVYNPDWSRSGGLELLGIWIFKTYLLLSNLIITIGQNKEDSYMS